MREAQIESAWQFRRYDSRTELRNAERVREGKSVRARSAAVAKEFVCDTYGYSLKLVIVSAYLPACLPGWLAGWLRVLRQKRLVLDFGGSARRTD